MLIVLAMTIHASDAQDPAGSDDAISPEPIDPVPGEIAPGEPADAPPPADAPRLPDEGSTENLGGVLPELTEDGANPPILTEDLTAGEPDAFADLDLELPDEEADPTTEGGAAALRATGEEAFDAGVLLGELLPGGFGAPLEREGFRFGLGVQGSYDSNIFALESDEVEDFIFTVSPSLEYRSAPPEVPGQVTVRYTPFIRLYLQESDLNTIDHSANATVSFTGTRGAASVGLNYGRFSRTERFVGGLVETESFGGSASGSYRVGSRTSLEANASASFTDDSGRQRSTGTLPGSSASDTWRAQVSALYQVTARVRVGPSVRYSHSESSSFDSRDALAFLGVVEFQPRNELFLSGSVGLERTMSDRFADETDLTGSVSASYRPNDRVSLQANLTYESIPQGQLSASRSGGGTRSLNGGLSATYTPNPQWSFAVRANAQSFPSADLAGTSIGDQTYGASVTRNLQNGSLTLDGSVSFSDYEAIGPVAASSRGDEEFFTAGLRYGRSVFRDRGSLDASLQWSDNSGDRDWQRFQAALGLSFEF